MLFFTLLLAILLVCLWMKVNDYSEQLLDLKKSFEGLLRRLEKLEQKVGDLPSEVQKPSTATASAPAHTLTPEIKLSDDVKTTPPPFIVESKPLPPAETVQDKTSQPHPATPPPIVPTPHTQQPRIVPKTTPPSRKLPKFDWENIVGVKLFSWIAGVALLLAAIVFLQYSIYKGWLMPEVRMAIGIITSVCLLIVCELKAARKYPVTANAMDAAAIAILFSTFFAAHSLWNLIGSIPAFILMVLVTAVAVLLSIRRDSVFIALLGLVGGFATPALLSTGENKPISLFAYLLLLNAGLAWVAAKKKWPLLTTLSLAFTVFYQWGWVIKFLSSDQMLIAIGIFLIFPILAFVAVGLGQKEDSSKGWLSLYGQTANLTAVLPLLFAFYAAAVPGYGQRYGLLFGFLFLMDVGLFAIAAAKKEEFLHCLGGISTAMVLALWMAFSYESSAWPSILGFVMLFSFFFLIAPFIAHHFKHSFAGIGKTAVYAAPLLLFVFPWLATIEPAAAAPGLLFATLFLLLLGVAAYAVLAEEGLVYFLAVVFALITEAAWSARNLTLEHLYSGLTVYAIFGLLFIAVPVAARRWRKTLRPEGASAGLLLIGLILLFSFATGSIASVSIWGLALLLLLLNAGLYHESVACKLPGLGIAGMALSWIILGVLWSSVSLTAILIPALIVTAGFALLVLAGNIWMQQKAPGANDALQGNGIFLGLIGHIFLLVIAEQKALSVPPWPFFGILLILTLAIGAAALYLRRNDIHLTSMIASGCLLILWIAEAEIYPWPAVGIGAAGILALLAFSWIYLTNRAGIDSSPFSNTASITLIVAQIATIVASCQSGTPSVEFLLGAQLIFLIALLAQEWFRKINIFVVLAVLTTAAAVFCWMLQHSGQSYWQQTLLFATPIYLVFITYPLLLGKRAERSIAPYFAAVLAGIPYFFQARQAIEQAGYGYAIGILPVIQAAFMALLMMRLLKIEPQGARSLGRLALVAGTALAFITAAIPLQLEKEWITIGWALEGAALAWLYSKIRHKGLLLASTGLFITVFIRLALNPYILHYQPRADARIWNWYLYTYLVSASALILGGWLISRLKEISIWTRIAKLFYGGGVLLLFILLNIEIADFYSVGSTITFKFSATLAQDLTYTLGWAIFAVALLVVGIAIRNQPARIAALALLVITILKCFIHDLGRLGGLYLVASLVGLAVCLALVALALQKYVLSVRKEGK